MRDAAVVDRAGVGKAAHAVGECWRLLLPHPRRVAQIIAAAAQAVAERLSWADGQHAAIAGAARKARLGAGWRNWRRLKRIQPRAQRVGQIGRRLSAWAAPLEVSALCTQAQLFQRVAAKAGRQAAQVRIKLPRRQRIARVHCHLRELSVRRRRRWASGCRRCPRFTLQRHVALHSLADAAPQALTKRRQLARRFCSGIEPRPDVSRRAVIAWEHGYLVRHRRLHARISLGAQLLSSTRGDAVRRRVTEGNQRAITLERFVVLLSRRKRAAHLKRHDVRALGVIARERGRSGPMRVAVSLRRIARDVVRRPEPAAALHGLKLARLNRAIDAPIDVLPFAYRRSHGERFTRATQPEHARNAKPALQQVTERRARFGLRTRVDAVRREAHRIAQMPDAAGDVRQARGRHHLRHRVLRRRQRVRADRMQDLRARAECVQHGRHGLVEKRRAGDRRRLGAVIARDAAEVRRIAAARQVNTRRGADHVRYSSTQTRRRAADVARRLLRAQVAAADHLVDEVRQAHQARQKKSPAEAGLRCSLTVFVTSS